MHKLVRMPVVEGTFLERVNRFTARVLIGGREELAWMNNTGRLLEFGRGTSCECAVMPRPKKLGFRLIALDGVLVDTRLQELAFRRAAERGLLPWLSGEVRAAPRVAGEVFDFLIGGRIVETKSAALRLGDFASYPDCPTERGRRHIRALAGLGGLLVFTTSLRGIKGFRPCDEGDPELAALLRRLKGVLEVRAVQFRYSSGRVSLLNPDLPVFI